MNPIVILSCLISKVTPGLLIIMKGGSIGMIVSVEPTETVYVLHVLWNGRVTREELYPDHEVRTF